MGNGMKTKDVIYLLLPVNAATREISGLERQSKSSTMVRLSGESYHTAKI